MANFNNYKELPLWTSSLDLMQSVYRLLAILPSPEEFHLADLIKKTVVEVPAHIAKGAKKAKNEAEFAEYLDQANSYLFALKAQLNILSDLGLETPKNIIKNQIKPLRLELLLTKRMLEKTRFNDIS
ncbi:four helix bundle protein [Robertkochia sediminum]|uniref:four helix bundle protein n=1 Tax=Robertkochia sediminum TaxID=2785326 RepID=UPI001931536A|nr:four helix bundle protein [Robertkochia sediminum]MBL7473724.1 four helix bundle protein [Robertkochia sediminum]